MDPISAAIGAMVLAWAIVATASRAGSDAKEIRRKAAEAGAWDFLDRDAQRREARRQARREAWAGVRQRRSRQAGGDGTYQPGAMAYLGDVYRGWWADQAKKREAKRAVRPDPVYVFDEETGKVRRDGPMGPSLKDKANAFLDRADAAIVAKATALRDSRPVRALIDPVGGSTTGEPAPDVAAATAPEPVDTDPVVDWEARVRPADAPDPWDRAEPVPPADSRPAERPNPTPTPTSDGGSPMTQATGETQTYEQHKAELAAQRQMWQTQLDLAAATEAAMAQAKAALNAQAEQARATAAAAQAKADGVSRLDGETQAHAGTQVDAADANRLDKQFEALEEIEADAAAAKSAAEAGMASVDAEERNIDARYGDAANTVASDLGGDASYLDSGGGGASPPAAAGGGGGARVMDRHGHPVSGGVASATNAPQARGPLSAADAADVNAGMAGSAMANSDR